MSHALPPALAPGDLLHVVHPAGRVDRQRLDQGIAWLRTTGLGVLHDPALGDAAGYLAGPDDARARNLRHALLAPGIGAVLAARGGYGTPRILPAAAEAIAAAAPRRDRWIVGYSDITALHLAILASGGVAVHGPLAMGLADDDRGVERSDLVALLMRREIPTLAGLRFLAHAPREPRRAPIAGGNLSLLASLVGTPYFPPLRGHWLLLEEIAEPPYRLDRMLTTLHLAGALDGLAGVLLGQFTRCGEDERGAQALVGRLLMGLGVPIAAGVPAGHGRPNRPLVLGWPYALGPDGSLVPDPVHPVSVHTRRPAGQHPAQHPPDKGLVDARPARPGPTLLPAGGRSGGVLSLLHDAIAEGACSAAQLVVCHRGSTRIALAAGTTARTADAERAPVTPDTRFDLASLTKALCTAPLAALAREQLGVALDDRIPADISGDRPSLRDLLRHTSGLPAHRPVFDTVRAAFPEDGGARQQAAEQAFACIPVEREHRGQHRYSDVGYVALGRWLERLFGQRLDILFRTLLAEPAGIADRIGFPARDPALAPPVATAATEWCPWAGHTLQGIVHDENAQVLGGVAGHAGLFGTAEAVAALAEAFLGRRPGPLSDLAVADMWDPRHRVGSHGLGWDTMSGPSSSAGRLLDRGSTVGHLGFTGTSLWIDRTHDLVVVLLTNRVHPSRDDGRIRQLRPAVHDAVFEALHPRPVVPPLLPPSPEDP